MIQVLAAIGAGVVGWLLLNTVFGIISGLYNGLRDVLEYRRRRRKLG